MYSDFRQKLDSILTELGCIALNTDSRPVGDVREIPLIPRERYRLMDKHFLKTGTGGIKMMRGTCSLQVSVDYFSEEDFRRKVRAAYFYTPLFKLLCDNSAQFAGKTLTGYLKRTDIWDRTDSTRCGVPPGIFAGSYGFADYAGFLCNMPPIFVIRERSCFLAGAFRTQIIHHKWLFHILHLERTRRFLSAEECAFVEAHIPKTIPFEPEFIDIEEVISHKDKYILKPQDSYASKGVYAGVEFPEMEWEKLAREAYKTGYICQDYCPQYSFQNIDFAWGDGEWHRYISMAGLYVYNRKFAGVFSRAAEGNGIIASHRNERTQPTYLVSEKNLSRNDLL